MIRHLQCSMVHLLGYLLHHLVSPDTSTTPAYRTQASLRGV
jgi:hypothetical protein